MTSKQYHPFLSTHSNLTLANASKFNIGLIYYPKVALLRKIPSPCPLPWGARVPPGEGKVALTKIRDKRGEGRMFACF